MKSKCWECVKLDLTCAGSDVEECSGLLWPPGYWKIVALQYLASILGTLFVLTMTLGLVWYFFSEEIISLFFSLI